MYGGTVATDTAPPPRKGHPMTRNQNPTRVNTRKHAPILLSAARHYAQAAARYQRTRHTSSPSHIARTRFLEVTATFDKLLTTLVLRPGHHGRTLATATDAALIKATARRLSDHLNETHLGPTHSPEATHDQLTHLIYETLSTREAEDTAALQQTLTIATPEHPRSRPALAA